jgi:hypothetical protein
MTRSSPRFAGRDMKLAEFVMGADLVAVARNEPEDGEAAG